MVTHFPTGSTASAPTDLAWTKPRMRGWLHALWFDLSLIAGTLLIVSLVNSDQHATTTAAAVAYAIAVSALFGTSALYHRGTWTPRGHALLQRLDHAMIFVLIVASATPVVVVTMSGPLRMALLVSLWSVALVALVTHLVWMDAPEVLVGGTYIVIGCLGGAALPAVLLEGGVAPFVLILTGGALYILGAVLYHRRAFDRWPTVFGFHEAFHVFVCAAAAVQYVAIALVVL